jgi:hypothetical protein
MSNSADKATGSSWSDVALALIQFAREDPAVFCGIMALLCLLVWLLFPRATRALETIYADKINNYRHAKIKKGVQRNGGIDGRK